MLAPVVIFAFNRPQSLANLLGDLDRDPLFSQSDKYIYIDGCRNAGDEEKQKAVVDIAKDSMATVIVSDHNKGLGNSIISGVSDVIARYGKVIVLEDDLRLMQGFLAYMNQALDMYEPDKRIISVCGYGLKIKRPAGYEGDVYLSPRSSSWGWGTWADRWNKIDWNVSDWEQFNHDRSAIKEFNRGGSDMYGMLKGYMKGRNRSWAIRFCYSQYRQGLYSVHPFRSFVDNEGFGEDATNCRQRWSRFKIEKAVDNQIITPPHLLPDELIFKQLRRYHSIPLRIISKVRKILNI